MTAEDVQALFSGYSLGHLQDRDLDPPITAAHRAYGSLWFDNEHPTVILSSKSIHKDVTRRIIPKQLVPVVSGLWLRGVKFNDAGWFPYEPLEGTDWVVMLNENQKQNPTRNGFYRFSVRPENRLGQEDLATVP